jgi:hypothetical protein
MEHRVIRDILASLRRLMRALGRSDVDAECDRTFATYQQEVAHVGVGMAAGLLVSPLGALWGALAGLAAWAGVQGWQWWQERRLPAQGARAADLWGDTIVVLGSGYAVLWLWPWIAGPLALGLGIGRAALRDAGRVG